VGAEGSTKKFSAQPVVQPNQFADRLGWQSLQEATKRRLIGKTFQPQQRKEGSIVLQDFGLIDAAQPCDQRIDQHQKQIAGMEIAAPIRNRHIALQPVTQAQAVAKTMNQHQAAEVSKLGVVEAKTQCSQAFWHDRRIGIAGFGANDTKFPIRVLCVRGRKPQPKAHTPAFFMTSSVISRIFEVQPFNDFNDLFHQYAWNFLSPDSFAKEVSATSRFHASTLPRSRSLDGCTGW